MNFQDWDFSKIFQTFDEMSAMIEALIDLMLFWAILSDSNSIITIVNNYREIFEFGRKS